MASKVSKILPMNSQRLDQNEKFLHEDNKDTHNKIQVKKFTEKLRIPSNTNEIYAFSK